MHFNLMSSLNPITQVAGPYVPQFEIYWKKLDPENTGKVMFVHWKREVVKTPLFNKSDVDKYKYVSRWLPWLLHNFSSSQASPTRLWAR